MSLCKAGVRMSKGLVFLLTVAVLAGCAGISLGANAAEPSGSLALVENGAPKATVVIPDDANPWTRMAAGVTADDF